LFQKACNLGSALSDVVFNAFPFVNDTVQKQMRMQKQQQRK